MKELYEKYRVRKKGLKTVIEELKQRMLAKSAKVKRYEQRIEQFRQNRIFDLDQKKIYAELNGNGIRSNGVPNPEECTKFWGNIWGVRKEHSLHESVSSQMNRILMREDDLPLMWKLLTGVIAEEMYNYLEREKILPEEQKGCRRGSRGTKDQLLIDKTVLKNCRKRHTNLSMAWIDYRKAYDLVPHSWVNECMEMFGIAENLRTFLQKSMQQWRLSLMANGEDLGEVNVKRGIFQGDSPSPLMSVLSMVPLSLILKKVNACYKWGKKEYKLNHLLFMDDLKLYAKSEEQTNTLARTVYVFNTDIGMEFGIKKCGILTMKGGRIVKVKG